jgi:hypothetical protein
MANPQAVRALLTDLKRVGSPVQRIKLLALAWRTVRELSPQERNEIASELGMKELSGLMERLGRKKDGVAPAEVLQALEQVDELDPKKVSTVLKGLWTPGTRKEAVRDGLEMLGRIFDEPEPEAVAEAEETDSALGVEAVQGEIEVEPEIDEVAAVATSVAEPIVVEPEAEEPEMAVVESAAAEPETLAAPTPDEPDEPTRVVPEEALAPEVPSGAVPPPPLAPGPPTRVIDQPEAIFGAAPEREPAVEEPEAPRPGSPVARLEAAPSASRRFRIVRELFAGGAGVDDGSLEALVEQFPDGWQRRRVLCLLFRKGLPVSTARALDLIGELERSVDRRWCAATLADTRDLTPAEIDDLLERFPFRGLGRRLRSNRKAS